MQSVVEAATRRVMESYALMRDDDAAEAVRPKIENFIAQAWQAGETDDNRLAISALIYLRKTSEAAAASAPIDASAAALPPLPAGRSRNGIAPPA